MPTFIADAMLGKLAKWLRILGYDTVYKNNIDDNDLLERAQKENRIILTRDTLLIKRRLAKNYILIQSDFLNQQLQQIITQFHLDIKTHLLTRCLICNEKLSPIEKENIKDKVPPYVFATQQNFSSCPKCRRIYWHATHVEHLLKKLDNL